MMILDTFFEYISGLIQYIMGDSNLITNGEEEEDLETFRVWIERSLLDEENSGKDLHELYLEDFEKQKSKLY